MNPCRVQQHLIWITFSRFTVMLNGIIIINWISNGLLLVVHKWCSHRRRRCHRQQHTNMPLYYTSKVSTTANNRLEMLCVDTCNLGSHCFHFGFRFRFRNLLLNCVPHQAVIYQIFWRCLFCCCCPVRSRQPNDLFLLALYRLHLKWPRKMNILFQASTTFRAIFVTHTQFLNYEQFR